MLIFITGHANNLSSSLGKFFQSSVFRPKQFHLPISPPSLLPPGAQSSALELLGKHGLHGVGEWEQEEGLFSVKILGFLQQTELQRAFLVPLQFLPLHSTTEPPHRYCSAPVVPHWVVKATARLRQVLKQLGLFSGCACAHRIYGVQQSHCHSYKRVSMEHVESEKIGILL